MKVNHGIRDEKGMTLLEVAVSGGILGVMMMIAMTAFDVLIFEQKRIKELSSNDRMVAGLMANVQSNMHLYHVTPEAVDWDNSKINQLLANDKLPMGFSDTMVDTVENCVGCSGRFGYVVQPISGMPDLFRVTMRIKKTDSAQVRDVQFITSFK